VRAAEHKDSAPAHPAPLEGGRGVSGGAWTLPDPLYGAIRVSAWAAVLLQTPPFCRLTGVSLSDVPGELLFRRPFPSRLEHALGVYHLARLARPRDRVLHVAALAHDLGHGPFSHLTEPHMRERFGEDHEARSARLLGEVRDALSPANARLLSWLDWSEAGRLVLGEAGGRGALLNGLLDYDNADNIARFLLASGLGMPSYDPRALACALRPLAAVVAGQEDTNVCLSAAAEADALGWRTDRARVYGYLHEGHRNLAAHSMLRKAVDMAAARQLLQSHRYRGSLYARGCAGSQSGRARRTGSAGRRALVSLCVGGGGARGCTGYCRGDGELARAAGAGGRAGGRGRAGRT
jgi:HD superfamily phosphohydrolase